LRYSRIQRVLLPMDTDIPLIRTSLHSISFALAVHPLGLCENQDSSTFSAMLVAAITKRVWPSGSDGLDRNSATNSYLEDGLSNSPEETALQRLRCRCSFSQTGSSHLTRKRTGLNLTDILLEKGFIRSVVASGSAFREFGAQNWRLVHQTVFVWDLQPHNPEILLPVFYVTRRVNGQANAKDLEIKIAPRKLCAEELWPWEFSQHMAIRNMTRRVLFKNHSMRPSLLLLRDTHISKNSYRLWSLSHPQSGAIRHDKSNSNCNPSILKVFST
jgi:hypothetical protein